MNCRKLPASRGAAWITEGLMAFKVNPVPYLSVCLLVGLLSSLPVVSMVVGLFSVIFYGGIVSALHIQAQGGTPQLAQAFDGFSRPGAFGRLIAIVLLHIAMAIAAIIILVAAMGPIFMEMIRHGGNVQPDETMLLSLLPRMGVAIFILFPLGIFFGWVILLAVPRAMLDEVSGVQAMREAVTAIFTNFGAMVVNLLCLLALMLVLMVVLTIPMVIVSMFSENHAMLGMLLQVPLTTLFTGMIFAIYGSIMYQAWWDLYGNETSYEPLHGSIEA